MKKLTIECLRKLAEDRGGTCLSVDYINCHVKILWKCGKGHEWNSSATNVRAGGWCHKCGYEKTASAKRHTIEKMQEIAKSRGGKCKSTIYMGAHKHLEWECLNRHIWNASPTSIISGSWCPNCSPFISERICREYFETIFNEKFLKIKPKWLKTGSNNSLELDGYCEKLGVAFEHQGVQHYLENKQFKYSKSKLREIQDRDEAKRILCKLNRVVLIEIPALNYYIKIKDLEDFIFSELLKNNIQPLTNRPILIDWKRVYTSEDINNFNKLKETIALRGGKLLSTEYSGVNAKYEIECDKKHIWNAKGSSITSNKTWCFHCRSENSGKTQKKKIMHIETGIIYDSLNGMARKLGLNASNICAAIKGRKPHIKGFSFKYLDK